VFRARVGGAEQEAFSRWGRRWLSWRAGERAALKAGANRRERHVEHIDLSAQVEEVVLDATEPLGALIAPEYPPEQGYVATTQEHRVGWIGDRDAEGNRTFGGIGEVCLGCSDPVAGRWVPRSFCSVADAEGAPWEGG
jgi:hypothetical protein